MKQLKVGKSKPAGEKGRERIEMSATCTVQRGAGGNLHSLQPGKAEK